MKKRIPNKFAIVLATILILAMIAQFPSIKHASAEVPAPSSWSGHGAMAHWNITDTAHDNARFQWMSSMASKPQTTNLT